MIQSKISRYFIFFLAVTLPLTACGKSVPQNSPTDLKSITVSTGISWNKAEFSSDGSRFALLGEGKKFAIVDVSTGKIAYGETETERPAFFGFSPDVSELWIIDRKGNVNRYHSQSARKLAPRNNQGAPVLWQLDTQKKDIAIIATAPLSYSLKTSGSPSVKMDFNGLLILNIEGKPFHVNDTLVLAKTAEDVSMWRAGATPLETKKTLSPPIAQLACNNECVIVANNPTEALTTLWPISQAQNQYFKLGGRLFLDRDNIGKPRLAINPEGTKAIYASGSKLGIAHLSLSGFDLLPLFADAPSLVLARLSKTSDFAIIKSDLEENQISVFNVNTMKSIPLPKNIDTDQRHAIISPDGMSWIGIGQNGEAILVMLGASLEEKKLAESFADVAFRFSSTGHWLTISTRQEGTTLLNCKSGEPIPGFDSDRQLRFIAFSPDDKYLVTGHSNGIINIQPTESL